MTKINSGTDLRVAILKLEAEQAYEEKVLKEQLHLAYESVKPVNLVKGIVKDVVESKDLKADLVNASVALTAGYLSKKLFEGVANGPIKKLLGTALMFGITNAVAKNPETVKTAGKGLFRLAMNMSGHKMSAKSVAR